jgi:hypothetical protein
MREGFVMDEYATKKDLEGFKEDIKQYMGILAEDFQHKLDFVIDGQEDIKKEVKEIHKELVAHRDNTEIHAQQAKRKRK